MIGVIVAMQKEARVIVENLKNSKTEVIASQNYYIGEINDIEIVLAISGIGKVNASVACQNLISNYKVSSIFNIGSCGGMVSKIKLGQCYQVYKCYQQDFDLSEVDNVEIGYMQDFDVKYFNVKTLELNLEKVVLATADSFRTKAHDIKECIDCGAEIKDMEGCAVAQTCLLNNIDCYIQKYVTDISCESEEIKKQYKTNIIPSAELIYNTLKEAISLINNK